MSDATSPRRQGAAPAALSLTVAELAARARALIVPGERRLLGLTGAPGAGKSTVSAALLQALSGVATLVPMDGFHLANAELTRLGRRDRKGAPDTFDADGYAALLARLRRAQHQTIYVPVFDRSLEESIGSAVPVAPDVPLILTEGNYLLLDEGDWARARAQLDEVWYVEVPEELRLERLIRRHEQFGKSPEDARLWATVSDQRNAQTIAATRARADLVVQVVG